MTTDEDLSALNAFFATVIENASQLEYAGEVSKLLHTYLEMVPVLATLGKTEFVKGMIYFCIPNSLFDNVNVEITEADRLLLNVAQSGENYDKFLRNIHQLLTQISEAELAKIQQEEEGEGKEGEDEEDTPPVSRIGSVDSNERTNSTIGMYSPARQYQNPPVQEYPDNTDGKTDTPSVVEQDITNHLAEENARRGQASAASTASTDRTEHPPSISPVGSTETDSAAEAGLADAMRRNRIGDNN